MSRYCIDSIDALKRPGRDDDGVVSLDHVVLTAFVVATVSAAFKAAATGPMTAALTSAMSKLDTAVSTVGGG